MATAPATPASESPAGGESYGKPGYRLYVLIVLTLLLLPLFYEWSESRAEARRLVPLEMTVAHAGRQRSAAAAEVAR